MKRYLLIIALLLGAVSSWGQTASDQAAVLQKILELPVLQQYYPKNGDGSMKQICIMQYPKAFSAEVIGAMDASKVVFRTSETVMINKEEAYFMFRSFTVEQQSCKVVLNYFFNPNTGNNQSSNVSYTIELSKTGSVWNVTNQTLGGTR